jgi:hypothetical protein
MSQQPATIEGILEMIREAERDRIKQTWAEWKVENLDRMAVICAIRYGEQWKNYWKQAK